MSGIKRKRDEDQNANTEKDKETKEDEIEEVKESAPKKQALEGNATSHGITPNVQTPNIVTHLISPDGRAHIAWMEKALDAKLISLIEYKEDPTKIMHCSLALNDSVIFLCDSHLALKKNGK